MDLLWGIACAPTEREAGEAFAPSGRQQMAWAGARERMKKREKYRRDLKRTSALLTAVSDSYSHARTLIHSNTDICMYNFKFHFDSLTRWFENYVNVLFPIICQSNPKYYPINIQPQIISSFLNQSYNNAPSPDQSELLLCIHAPPPDL